MYNIKLDENKYYTGSYAKVGRVQGGIDIPTLPPTEDPQRALFYRYDDYEDPVTTQQPKTQTIVSIDELTGESITTIEYVLDEEGNIVYEDVTVYITKTDWIFDDEKYQAYLDEQANIVPEPTTDEKVSLLQEENELLKGCIMELADVLFN